ncbi:MAG: hypothetical protein ACRCS8_04420 [Brevinema sp.]
MIFLFLLLISLPISNFAFVEQDTLSIKGSVIFRDSELMGEFWYTVRNNSDKAQATWTVLVHHGVNILSIQEDGQEAPFTIQNGSSFRAITIKLPKPIKPNSREQILIKFSLTEQSSDPRFTIKSDHVFLDARKLWFPHPYDDHLVSSEITIETPRALHGVIGSKLQNDAIIVDRRITTWQSELPSLSPRMSLLITDQPRRQHDFLHVYTDNEQFAEFLYKKLEPFWSFLSTKHKKFPLSQIHILPSDNPLDQITADGEFLGNLILLNKEMIAQYIKNPKSSFFESGSIDERIIETIIHELYHAFFPGQITHVKADSLFMESFVQYLTWDLIQQIDPLWGQRISRRSHFLMQNFFNQANKNNLLHNFLLETMKLLGTLNYYHIDSITLIDTLIEKYRFIEMSKQDLIDTIIQFDERYAHDRKEASHLEILRKNNSFPFNAKLKVETTNITVTITNKKRRISIPLQDNMITISHNLQGTWRGNLLLMTTNSTNVVPVRVAENTIWETNIIGIVDQVSIVSPLDLLESNLADNILKKDQIGIKLSKDINANRLEKWTMTPQHRELISKLRSFRWRWNQTSTVDNKIYMSFNLQNQSGKNISFVIIEMTKNGPITDIRTLL